MAPVWLVGCWWVADGWLVGGLWLADGWLVVCWWFAGGWLVCSIIVIPYDMFAEELVNIITITTE